MPFYFLVLVSTSSNQPSRLNTSVFITLCFSSGVISSSSLLSSSCVTGSTSSSDCKVSSSLSTSASSKITPKLSSGTSFSSDVAISITSSLVILSLILGEMSSGFFTFFLEVKLYQRFLLVYHHCFYVENYSLPQLKVILLMGQTRK